MTEQDEQKAESSPDRHIALKILEALSPREAAVLQYRYGIGRDSADSYDQIASKLDVSVDQVRQIERAAIRKLKEPSLSQKIPNLLDADATPLLDPSRTVEVRALIEQVSELTPELIFHLKRQSDDLQSVPPDVFEHLVAELLTSIGLTDVRLVGKNSCTAADIFATQRDVALGSPIRYFVEVKRWRDKIGVEVIDRVLGAMLQERPKLGWHAAMVVSINGFKNFKKYNHRQLALLGVDLKDKQDLTRWLVGYRPAASGLWVPRSHTSEIPEV